MLVLVTFLKQQQQNNSIVNTAMAQIYDKYRDSSYSQYPTDDKKYDWRTGPFEGFFVSSVEFCDSKHNKFKNDRKDNNRTIIKGSPAQQILQVLMVYKEFKAYKGWWVLMEQKVNQVL